MRAPHKIRNIFAEFCGFFHNLKDFSRNLRKNSKITWHKKARLDLRQDIKIVKIYTVYCSKIFNKKRHQNLCIFYLTCSAGRGWYANLSRDTRLYCNLVDKFVHICVKVIMYKFTEGCQICSHFCTYDGVYVWECIKIWQLY